MNDGCRWHCPKTHLIDVHDTTFSENISLVVFDMDGVLADIEGSWRAAHKYFGTNNNSNVDAYLNGRLSDDEFIRSDIQRWRRDDGSRPDSKELTEIYKDAPSMKGSSELVRYLHRHEVTTAIVSAGVDILALDIGKRLEIPHVIANHINIREDGKIDGTGIVNVPLLHKDASVMRLAEDLDIPLSECVAIGNSCFDIPMFHACGLGICFNPSDECVIKAADITIDEKDLSEVIRYLEPFL